MNYAEARAIQAKLYAAYTEAADAMDIFPRGVMGLTPDDVKATPEWKQAFALKNRRFQDLRKFNATFTKVFKSEIRADRDAKRAAR